MLLVITAKVSSWKQMKITRRLPKLRSVKQSKLFASGISVEVVVLNCVGFAGFCLLEVGIRAVWSGLISISLLKYDKRATLKCCCLNMQKKNSFSIMFSLRTGREGWYRLWGKGCRYLQVPKPTAHIQPLQFVLLLLGSMTEVHISGWEKSARSHDLLTGSSLYLPLLLGSFEQSCLWNDTASSMQYTVICHNLLLRCTRLCPHNRAR